MVRLDGRTALVTGAGRGIGRATALALADAGAAVALLARSRDQVAAVAAEVGARGGRALAVPADVADRAQVDQAVAQVLATFGRLDILVNCAGVAWLAAVEETTPDTWEQTLAVNLSGTFWCCQAAWTAMAGQGGGVIVNVSSSAGKRGRARWDAYSASKFGVIGLTECLADEGKLLGIRVNAVCPGATNTEMRERIFPGENPALRQPPERVAEVILWLVGDEARHISGQALDVLP